MTVYIIGLGIGGFNTIPLAGLKILRKVTKVFVEKFSNPIFQEDIIKIRRICGNKLIVVSRKDMEDGEMIFNHLNEDIAIICGGDPLIATTHQQLLLDIIKRGVKVRVINASSIVTAAIGRSGLHVYKFGPIGTIMRPNIASSESTFKVLVENLKRGLHTLLLLEYDETTNYIMKPSEAIDILIGVQDKLNSTYPKAGAPVLILSRLGTNDEKLVGFKWGERLREDIDGPAVIIFPGKLHFTEREFIREVFKLDI